MDHRRDLLGLPRLEQGGKIFLLQTSSVFSDVARRPRCALALGGEPVNGAYDSLLDEAAGYGAGALCEKYLDCEKRCARGPSCSPVLASACREELFRKNLRQRDPPEDLS